MELRKKLEQQITEKAMKDESFRKQLIEDPKGVLEQETGMKLPDSMNFIILEEDAQNFYLVLPPKPTIDEDGTLTDADLTGVSGGWGSEEQQATYSAYCN